MKLTIDNVRSLHEICVKRWMKWDAAAPGTQTKARAMLAAEKADERFEAALVKIFKIIDKGA